MPKHVPTFKHLISTSTSRQDDRTRRERTVNDLLEASRAQQRIANTNGRDAPPHIPSGSVAAGALWAAAPVPSVAELASGEGSIHPAELVRREQAAHRQASRSVAGPAPPRSWRPIVPSKGVQEETAPHSRPEPTYADLRRSASVFTAPSYTSTPSTGCHRLVEHCLNAVLGYMNSQEVLEEDHDGGKVLLGDVMRDQAAYLDSHLKAGLLEMSSFLPVGHRLRMSDKTTRGILTLPYTNRPAGNEWESEVEEDDWGDTDPTIHHLPLILHPAPVAILRQSPSMSALSLTSLNLAYSTIVDMDRLVAALPVGLRELSLCGVKVKRGEMSLAEGDAWRRALGAIGRKLIVLTRLDLSEPPFPHLPHTFATLLHPPQVRLPSLRLLVLREEHTRQVVEIERKKLTGVIRGEGRHRYVEVVWD